jgi:hypothetical protein
MYLYVPVFLCLPVAWAGGARPVPLLVLTIHDFVLQQTDPQWHVVDLRAARRHNRGTDTIHVFRQATAMLSAHLVPYTGAEGDPARALLRGVHLSKFAHRRDHDGARLGGPLGSAVILERTPLTVRSIMLKRARDASNQSLQFDVLLPTVQVRFQKSWRGIASQGDAWRRPHTHRYIRTRTHTHASVVSRWAVALRLTLGGCLDESDPAGPGPPK